MYVYVCMYVCMYLCMFVSLTQISLTPIATLYDNGFSGRVRVQKTHHVHLINQLASLRDRRNQTARVK